MRNLLDTDIGQVSQLPVLVEAQLYYHWQALQILDELAAKLKRRMRKSSSHQIFENKLETVQPHFYCARPQMQFSPHVRAFSPSRPQGPRPSTATMAYQGQQCLWQHWPLQRQQQLQALQRHPPAA